MATLTGKNLLSSIIESTDVEINTLVFNTLSVRLQQMIDNGTHSNLAVSIAVSGFSTAVNNATEITALSDAVQTNTGLIEYADEDEVGTIEFPPYGDDDVNDKDTIYVGSLHDTYPYSAVVYIETRFPSGEMYTGSGAVVGRNDVLTASHVIYSVEEGGLAEDITVFPGRNGSDMPFGSYDWDFVDYFEVDLDGDGYLYRSDSEKDLAVIGFDQPIGDATGWFGLDGNGTSGNYNLTGYPGIYADETGVRMTNDYGFVSKDERSVFNYTSLEINPGNSGGPLWYLSDLQGPFVAGIASTTDWAASLELHYDTVMDWIEGNNYLLDESLNMETLGEAAGVSLAEHHFDLEIMGINNAECDASLV